jgi:hypothetical protein
LANKLELFLNKNSKNKTDNISNVHHEAVQTSRVGQVSLNLDQRLAWVECQEDSQNNINRLCLRIVQLEDWRDVVLPIVE